MKKLTLVALAVATMTVTGCMGTRALSHNISDDGHVESAGDLVFPRLEDAWEKDGSFPNLENLSKVRPGIIKDDLYQLIGRPHFDESNRAREWDYIFKFYTDEGAIKVCQYKVIFDKEFKGQEFYWMPSDCLSHATKPAKISTVPVPVTATQVVREKISLEADTLFRFDKWSQADMLPQGRAKLDELASKLVDYQKRGDTRVVLTGHTDHFGDDMYNMNLSMLRAQTVRQYLVSRGVEAGSMVASGAGESQPVVRCNTSSSRNEQIQCLQPNRRVDVEVVIYAQ